MAFMTANPSSFTDNTVKILYILTQCKGGTAGPWGMVKMEHYTNTAWLTWDACKKLFASTFYPANVQQSAVDALSNLQQKDGQCLINFEALWDMLTHQADIKEDLNHARSYLSCISK